MSSAIPLPIGAICAAVVFLATFSACGSGRTKTMPTADSNVLEVAIALASSQSLEVEKVATMLGVTMTEDAAGSNRFFTVFRGRGGVNSVADEVEYRVPRQGTSARGPMIYFIVKQSRTPSAAQIIARLGRPHVVRVPSPQAAATGSSIYVYRAANGELRFAIGTPPTEPVLSVAIDRTE